MWCNPDIPIIPGGIWLNSIASTLNGGFVAQNPSVCKIRAEKAAPFDIAKLLIFLTKEAFVVSIARLCHRAPKKR